MNVHDASFIQYPQVDQRALLAARQLTRARNVQQPGLEPYVAPYIQAPGVSQDTANQSEDDKRKPYLCCNTYSNTPWEGTVSLRGLRCILDECPRAIQPDAPLKEYGLPDPFQQIGPLTPGEMSQDTGTTGETDYSVDDKLVPNIGVVDNSQVGTFDVKLRLTTAN